MNFRYIRQLAEKRPVILGSSSPRRFRLLTDTGIDFHQVTPLTDENLKPDEAPYAYAKRLAEEKALEVSAQHDGQLVIGADTVVLLEGEVLGKPDDDDDAFRILTTLSGKKHEVCTALALVESSRLLSSGYEITEVFFNSLEETRIRDYIATGEPNDKAGAYGIQGIGAFLVDRINGNLDNVIGFPCTLLETLAREAIDLL